MAPIQNACSCGIVSHIGNVNATWQVQPNKLSHQYQFGHQEVEPKTFHDPNLNKNPQLAKHTIIKTHLDKSVWSGTQLSCVNFKMCRDLCHCKPRARALMTALHAIGWWPSMLSQSAKAGLGCVGPFGTCNLHRCFCCFRLNMFKSSKL